MNAIFTIFFISNYQANGLNWGFTTLPELSDNDGVSSGDSFDATVDTVGPASRPRRLRATLAFGGGVNINASSSHTKSVASECFGLDVTGSVEESLVISLGELGWAASAEANNGIDDIGEAGRGGR